MIGWRFAVLTVLLAAAVAGCITYFATPAPPQPIEADQQSPPTAPIATARPDSGVSKEYSATKCGRRHNCLSASRRGHPKASAECEGVRR